MKVVCLRAPGDIRIEETNRPERANDHVLIKVRSAGICGSDIGAYRGTNPLVTYPRIIGHEIAGEIVEVAADETMFAVGDRIVLEPYVYCGKCYPCSLGRTNCCENLTVLGVHIEGGMAEYFSHPRHLVHKAPDNIPWEIMPMVEPLVIAMQAVKRAQVKAGEHVVITGAGPIGLLAAQYALTLGAVPVVVDPVAARLELAGKLGINYVINPVVQDAVQEIKAITNGRMGEAVIEASGDARAIRNSIDYVAYAGRISLVGWPKSEISLPTALFTKKELNVVGSRNSVNMFPESLRLIAEQKVNVGALVTKTIPMAAVPALVEDIAARPEKYLKVIAMF
ncbi:zinc-binding alcohol dehydrogenase family protein [Sporolituus thermophilus]|uniref:2-desacetyl-2-hydroxyethyl bacteriochlorophyllide A dehydrogenase n=1 Tax=Sporolituus thermophilus DSM 23256 TaxID=1123285 RepID=A0A1G7K8D5_9FIRM|nr:zinc-binding alcohol dehydrogenase family protein [Sporolituus thermophilus]SDF33432.1 2-desacetyl-2-hydroxyethyl bacteriochlorophyllide A dehydrogenase [Sporolituus thermophilus DSM 23256]